MTATVPTTSTRHPLRVVLLLGFLLSAAMAAAEEGTLYTLQADGLACPFCAYGIEKQLYRIDGVASVSTDVNRGTVIITM